MARWGDRPTHHLVEFHERFATFFGKTQAQHHAYTYLRGLMCCPERKSIEPIALCIGDGQVSGLQKFIGVAPWAYDDVQAEAQALFVERFAAAAKACPIGVVGVVDKSAFAKKETQSAGVARRHDGRRGKQDNCQVGVFLIGVAPRAWPCSITRSTSTSAGLRARTPPRDVIRPKSPETWGSGPSPRSPRP